MNTTRSFNIDTGNDGGWLGAFHRESLEEGLPVIPPETAALLRVLTETKKPSRILEIGCAVGFSACLMAMHGAENCRVTTIDRYDYMIGRARENFRKYGLEDRITLIEGDAAGILPMLAGPFGLIFVDAAKAQYLSFLPECLRLLELGGLLVCDDVLTDVDKDRYAIPRRKRTAHSRMRAFLAAVTEMDGLVTTVLNIGGGVSVTVKTKAK